MNETDKVFNQNVTKLSIMNLKKGIPNRKYEDR